MHTPDSNFSLSPSSGMPLTSPMADTLTPMPPSRPKHPDLEGTSAPTPPPVTGGSKLRFEHDALPVLGALTAALSALIRALPEPIDGPRDLERALDIDYVLAWRTYKVATAADPAAVGADVPRAAPMKRLLEAAKRKRIRAAIIQTARTAYHDFEDLVRRHAGEGPKRGPGARSAGGGRAVFDALIGGVRQGSTHTLDIVNRRTAFKTSGYIWGMQAQTTYRCVIWHTGEHDEQLDGVLLSGFTQLHALRPDVPIILKRMSGIMVEHSPHSSIQSDFLPPTGIRMLDEFTSRPLPQVHAELKGNGHLDVSLKFDGIGKGAAVDCAMQEIMRNANNSIPQDQYRMQVTSVTPAEVMLIVMLVPRGWADPATLKVTTHGNPALMESLRTQVPLAFELPILEHAEHLGSDLNTLASPDVPALVSMITATLDEQGWRDTEFDIFRCRVRYPILHTLVHLRVAAE